MKTYCEEEEMKYKYRSAKKIYTSEYTIIFMLIIVLFLSFNTYAGSFNDDHDFSNRSAKEYRMKCPSCGWWNNGNFIHCGHCGFRLR